MYSYWNRPFLGDIRWLIRGCWLLGCRFKYGNCICLLRSLGKWSCLTSGSIYAIFYPHLSGNDPIWRAQCSNWVGSTTYHENLTHGKLAPSTFLQRLYLQIVSHSTVPLPIGNTLVHFTIPSKIECDVTNGPRSVSCDRAIRCSGSGVRSVGPVGDFLEPWISTPKVTSVLLGEQETSTVARPSPVASRGRAQITPPYNWVKNLSYPWFSAMKNYRIL